MSVSSRAAAVAAALALGLAGCSAPLSPTTGPTASATPVSGSSLSPTDFAAATKLPNTVILDVRTPSEFASGHLAGAVNAVDVESSGFAQQVSALDPTKTYAVYCRSGNRSKVAVKAMQQAGIVSLYDLAGGITAWQSGGGQVVQ